MSKSRLVIQGHRVARGETRDIRLPISQTYAGESVDLPIRVWRAARSGPTVFLTAALHGDEINGVGIIRELMFDDPPDLRRGTILFVPVVNVFSFENNTRYMPDGRDLNRCFPGSEQGSLASRFARRIMQEIVSYCDFGLDLHSAAATRTNFPNVRGDVGQPAVRQLAEAFGCELVVRGKGPEGSFRRAACAAGCPTVILEAGEVGKVEPAILAIGVRGVKNVLVHLGMSRGEIERPPYQAIVNRTTWVRAELGGLLRFHVAPGQLVHAGQPLATNASIFGMHHSVLISPVDGIVLGMTTHPAVKPGEPVCHIALLGRRLSGIRKALGAVPDESAHVRVRDELATSVTVAPADTRPP